MFARDAYGSDKHVVLVKLRDSASVSQRMVRGDLPVLTRERFVAEMKSAKATPCLARQTMRVLQGWQAIRMWNMWWSIRCRKS